MDQLRIGGIALKKTYKRTLSLALCLVLLVGALVPSAFATDVAGDAEIISPRYERLHHISANLYISPTGMAECTGSARSDYDTDTIELSVTLQRKNSSKVWIAVESWYSTGRLIASKTGSIQVTGGYEYRTRVIASLYKSDGTFVEAVTIYSGTDIY